jgi:hypothetical protein
MKWVQHQSTSHNNLKFQTLLAEFGMAGYGKWWVCVELVAAQGQNYRIKSEKNWKDYLKKVFGDNNEQLEKFLEVCGSSNLIEKASLKKGDLHIPKMSEYCDDYSKKKVRRVSGQDTDNIPLEEKRREEKIKEEKRIEDTPFFKTTDYLKNIPSEDMTDFETRFIATTDQIKSKAEDLSLYCESKGKRYKNYKSFLLNALKKDFKQKTGVESKYANL